MTNLDDILKGRLAAPMKERDRAKAAPGRIQVAERPAIDIAPEPIEQFGGLLRENVTAEEIFIPQGGLPAFGSPSSIFSTSSAA